MTTIAKVMARALRLALRGRGMVSPNPRVGAVVVGDDGRVLGEGWHHRFGEAHAEALALRRLPADVARGGTIYVNIEPCCHLGKTPPCTETIIRSGIRRVVASSLDPFPEVNGQGVKRLQEAGVEVEVGLLAAEAQRLNRGYFSWIERGRAWCAAKVALSLDGRMADVAGRSKWISGPEARRLAHILRADCDGVLVGGGTVRADDPELTVRLVKGPNPVRIILAPDGGLPLTSKIATGARQVRTILVVGEQWVGSQPEGVELLRLPRDKEGLVSPVELLSHLPPLGVCSVLIEGGAGVLSSFLSAGVLDELSVAYSPSIIGKGLAPFERFTPESWEDRPRFRSTAVKRFGEDVVVTYHPEATPCSPG